MTNLVICGKRLSRNESRLRGIVAEQRMSCFNDGAHLSMIPHVIEEKDLSSSESASSMTRCWTRLRMCGAFSAMLDIR